MRNPSAAIVYISESEDSKPRLKKRHLRSLT
jgi:hypothetical protein